MTSVDWLEKEIYKRGPIGADTPTWLKQLYEQAKEMHKQEIINTWYNGYINQSPMIDEENCGEQFYQETFSSKESDECYFEPTLNTSSTTICKHCSREKFLHKT